MAKKRKKKKAKPKIELKPEEKAEPVQEAIPELSETPVIEDEQATAPVESESLLQPSPLDVVEDFTTAHTVVDKPLFEESRAEPGPETRPTRMPQSLDDIPVTPRPEVEKEPEPIEPTQPVICAGCKRTVEVGKTKLCLICPGNLRFCSTCAKPGSCHKCGKGLK